MSGAETSPDLAHPEVLPLLRGAWLGKPSAAKRGKTRFFQLSADGTTLRWGWKKHVLLFHVDELVCNDDELAVTLVMTMDRDVHLKFLDRRTCAGPAARPPNFNDWGVHATRVHVHLGSPCPMA